MSLNNENNSEFINVSNNSVTFNTINLNSFNISSERENLFKKCCEEELEKHYGPFPKPKFIPWPTFEQLLARPRPRTKEYYKLQKMKRHRI